MEAAKAFCEVSCRSTWRKLNHFKEPGFLVYMCYE